MLEANIKKLSLKIFKYLTFILLICFGWNSKPHLLFLLIVLGLTQETCTCQAGTLPLPLCPQTFCFSLLFSGRVSIFVGAGLGLRSSYLSLSHSLYYRHKPPYQAYLLRWGLCHLLNCDTPNLHL
jgi:hypothetical protein